MNPKDLDLVSLSRLLSSQLEHVTCIECCNQYKVPTTAKCGHTLCRSCWSGRCYSCPFCNAKIDKNSLKLNVSLQSLTGDIISLADEFEDLYKMKVDEYLLDFPANEEIQIDPHKHKEVAPIPPPQDDWDKIEEMPDSDDIEITLKIGNTVITVCDKKGDDDIKLKINTNRRIQISLDNNNDNKRNVDTETNTGVTKITSLQSGTPKVQVSENTDTAKAQSKIHNRWKSESNGKEIISYIMDKLQRINKLIKTPNSNLTIDENVIEYRKTNPTRKKIIAIPIKYSSESDITASENNTPSPVLISTLKSSHLNSLKRSEKRDREISDIDEIPSNKKMKKK